ncbi:MAG TPA: hypothetical protein VJM14_19180 [Burkholderiales bacterium]|nr:hypothetical protein [Burkholderiales bacterium]
MLTVPGYRSIVVAFLTAVALGGCGELCKNELVQTLRSPDGRFDAVVFTRSCTARTGYTTQLSVLPAETVLPDAEGNALVVRGDPRIVVRWETRRRLGVTGLGQANTKLKLTRIGEVEVVYRGG